MDGDGDGDDIKLYIFLDRAVVKLDVDDASRMDYLAERRGNKYRLGNLKIYG